jgi:SAM-dependent methyltransferase
MTSERDIIAYKTQAWADPGMVDWYARRVTENVGVNRLINRVETELIAANLRGRTILDIGIGTGRASLPLLDHGLQVTGIDSSQAMLDECRRRAGDRPIHLTPGDVTAVPFEDAGFDSAISLNVLTHFPNWRAVLPEWLRVVRPGGRVVFDVYSMDHVEAVARNTGDSVEALLAGRMGEDPSRYNLRLRLAELAEFADAQGVALLAAHPYSGTLGGDQNFWLARGWAHGRMWERLQSWIAEDEKLFHFLAFLELEGFARMGAEASGRFMVVLEKRAPQAGENAALVDRQARLNALWTAGDTRLSDLAACLGEDGAAWRARLDGHLDHPRNRLFLFHLLTALSAAGARLDIEDWFGARHAVLLDRWLLALELDRQIYGLASGWHRQRPFADILAYKGVSLGPALEYDSVRAMMRVALGAEHAE